MLHNIYSCQSMLHLFDQYLERSGGRMVERSGGQMVVNG